MKTQKNNSLKLTNQFLIIFIILSLIFMLIPNKMIKAEGENSSDSSPLVHNTSSEEEAAEDTNLERLEKYKENETSDGNNDNDEDNGNNKNCTYKRCVNGKCKSIKYDKIFGSGCSKEDRCDDNSDCKDDKEKCYCDACVGGCNPGCRKKAFYEDDCPCVDDCSECGGPSPEDEEICSYENPNPAEKKECTTKCKSSCQDMWHADKSCTYRNWWEFWTLWKKHDGNCCCPDTCNDLAGYTCKEGEVCPDKWISLLTGEKKCCSAQCVKPCGYSGDNESSATGLTYIEELGLDIEELAHDADISMETDAIQEVIKAGGVAVCADECIDLNYTVEASCDSSNEWCKNCIASNGSHCCVYCPPKTVYEKGKGCVKPSCDSCEKITGLPYNKNNSKNILNTGYSICKKECKNIDLGEGIIWKAYSPSRGGKWCSQINGGTDFEEYNKCCIYCPPGMHYSAANKSCNPDLNISKLTSELDCPYIVLSWEKYKDAISYKILPFYDKDRDKTEDGKCEEDIINKEKSPFYYNLNLSSCIEYYTGNVRLQLIPQYPNTESINSYNTEWIDVSECDLKT